MFTTYINRHTVLVLKTEYAGMPFQDRAFMQNVFQYLKRNCNEESDAARIEAIFGGEARNAALLVSERLINVPEELAPPLYKGLFEEIMWATEDEVTKDCSKEFVHDPWVTGCRVYVS
jgi:protein BCP1